MAKRGAKKSLVVSGLDEYIKNLTKLNADVPHVVESALKATYGYVHKEINMALKEGNPKVDGGRTKPIYLNQTNDLRKSFIDKAAVEWSGKTASIRVGFDQNKSMHATYLMITGNPYIKPNRKLYNAIYGNKAKIKEIQTEIFENAITEAMGRQ